MASVLHLRLDVACHMFWLFAADTGSLIQLNRDESHHIHDCVLAVDKSKDWEGCLEHVISQGKKVPSLEMRAFTATYVTFNLFKLKQSDLQEFPRQNMQFQTWSGVKLYLNSVLNSVWFNDPNRTIIISPNTFGLWNIDDKYDFAAPQNMKTFRYWDKKHAGVRTVVKFNMGEPSANSNRSKNIQLAGWSSGKQTCTPTEFLTEILM